MPTVTQAVETLVRATVDLPDAEMGRAWVWREYDEEGLRFALLMAQHELRDLAVRLAAMRPAPPTQAQRILGQYHHAYRDLTGALAGVRDEDLDRVPKEGEWPLREVIEHMLGAEYGFLGTVQYARDPDRPADEEEAGDRWPTWRKEHGYAAPGSVPGGIADVRNAMFEIHRRVLRELGDLRDQDLEKLAGFWDGLKPIRFRMHRFEAHMIQHTIQVDKTLEWLGRAPTEARRLVRVLYRDLAAVEMLSSDGFGQRERDEVAKTINERATEIVKP
ncbi:MAG TPA: DinB family protein [Candidatus Limnocylindria bacterium]